MNEIVIHAVPWSTMLLLWGESREYEPPIQGTIGQRRRTVPEHPFDASGQQLAEAVRAAASIDETEIHHSDKGVVWIPSARWPTESTDPPYEGHEEPQALRTRPWIVRQIQLRADEGIRFLMDARPVENDSSTIKLGQSTRFWRQAAKLTMSAIARGQYLPYRSSDQQRMRALWTPAWHGPFREARDALIRTMPDCARSLVNGSPRNPIEPPQPAEIFDTFTNHITDLIVQRESARTIPDLTNKTQTHMVGRNMHDSWLTALTHQPARRTGGGPDHTRKLREQQDKWLKPLQTLEEKQLVINIHLEPPEAPRTDWRIKDSVSGPKQKGAPQPLHETPPEQHAEAARAALASAIGLSPTIARLTASGAHGQQTLTATQALDFAKRERPILEDHAFKVTLPADRPDPQRPPRLTFTIATAPATAASITAGDLIDFRWQTTLDGEPITEEEFLLLADSKERLIRFRNRWLDLSEPTLRSAIQNGRRLQPGRASPGELMLIHATGHPLLNEHAFDGIAVDGDNQPLRVLTQARLMQEPERPLPPRLQQTMRAYQLRGTAWMDALTDAGWGVLLADDMGTGKTIQTLATLLQKKLRGEEEPALIIGPTSTVTNWMHEAARFTPELRMTAHHGPGRASTPDELNKRLEGYDAVVTSYTTAQMDAELLASVQWGSITMDEAQNVKNPDTARARACRKIPARHRIALSGTPVQNRPADLRAIIDQVNPGLLNRTAPATRQAGAAPDDAQRLANAARPFIMRRLKTDPDVGSSLPERIDTTVKCSLTPEQAALYQATLQNLDDALTGADGGQRRTHILAVITRLKQICNHPSHFLQEKDHDPSRSGKLSRMVEIIEEITLSEQKAVIFTDYVRMAVLIREALHTITAARPHVFHGRLSTKARENVIRAFSEDEKQSALIVSLRAGGTGINLTAANHAIHYDRWWNPAVEEQASDRLHRIGQRRTVHVHRMVCAGTLEERIDRIIAAKAALGEQILNAEHDWLTGMSEDDIRNALAIDPNSTEDIK